MMMKCSWVRLMQGEVSLLKMRPRAPHFDHFLYWQLQYA
jgi:hypothetical protein